MALKDVKSRIASIKNIQKITRAMEMVSAARLRRAEQRISVLRPYAGAIRRMTRQAADAAQGVPRLPILEGQGKTVVWYATGRRGVSSLTFRGREVTGEYTGFTERPAYANAREIASDLIAAYIDGEIDRVD